ncbi:dicarboxylate/amino acid:cation symporter [Lactiplantibacillus pentosus]|uniref:Proton/sodium-glutamate symport protein n=2 Tax=Lactiplantibacillus pentosus TaxID=1589 RepID=G0M4B9_LACPE|nr:dicarboxylate/amino acid:cation symporter [Lactiplantibacillus pentosus]CCC17036.1 proton/sodium-glutamate symport protein [Lactiplantibacillus pentosus IG1]MCT3301722.1 dicarboxylate/amino acid:cation symporter [Lactiplantibacillus pentosus]PRO80021.1 dicarboxylate/amino acid:cation symporter [Lactiplantibacillus pentosus]PRO82786.1 dicarboxylate/amino acid:cation symporter [Lactiplantibacillus pentosus]PRO92689.1 dicarboxylate/amino acid:cation symporter [Lactiplantibacillus pentosus]
MATIKRIGFPYQLLIALVLAVIFGNFLPIADSFYNLLGTVFINAITMIILPLIFPVVITAVVKIFNQKSFGHILLKTFVYFFVITTIIIALFLLAAYYFGFGTGTHASANVSSLKGIGTSINLWTFLASIVPANIIKAFSDNNLLSVIFFAIVLGLGLGAYGPAKAKPLLNLFDIWIEALYKITDFIIKLSPIGIFGIIAHDVSSVGTSELVSLVTFIVGLYVGYAALLLIVFPIIASIYRVPYLATLREIRDLFTLAFFTGSSSVVLPKLLERLKANGASQTVTDFVIPLGYTFNLEGATVYLSLAVAFVANSYNLSLSLTTLATIVLLLTFISKTIATVPSGAIVVLLATATQLGLPKEGVALIFAVDFFANAGRTALNVLGNAIAAKAIEGQLQAPATKPISSKLANE